MNEEEIEEMPIVTAVTNWETGLTIQLEWDTSYEPVLDTTLFYAQFVATLQAVGFSDAHIERMFASQSCLKEDCKGKDSTCPSSKTLYTKR